MAYRAKRHAVSIHVLVLLFVAGPGVDALGCMRTICSNDARQFTNQIRPCTADGFCGDYKSLRRNNQFLEAVELTCNEGAVVYAPFDGELEYHRPFGDSKPAECANQGARIQGVGQWRGYYVLISTVKLYRYGGRVKAGEKLGVAGNLECFDSGSSSTSHKASGGGGSGKRAPKNYVRVELFRNGRPIDPTYHLIDCMCVGQLCETNRNNAIIGAPFKYDSRYNGVRGWELKCPLRSGKSTSKDDAEESEERDRLAPEVYSPIEGNVIGRVRLDFSTGSYVGCANEGLFIVGSGKWADYEARIYNARFLEELGLGVKRIEQGQRIGSRLTCRDAPDSIFVEMRFQGALVDISDAVSAKSCQHKRLSRLFRF